MTCLFFKIIIKWRLQYFKKFVSKFQFYSFIFIKIFVVLRVSNYFFSELNASQFTLEANSHVLFIFFKWILYIFLINFNEIINRFENIFSNKNLRCMILALFLFIIKKRHLKLGLHNFIFKVQFFSVNFFNKATYSLLFICINFSIILLISFTKIFTHVDSIENSILDHLPTSCELSTWMGDRPKKCTCCCRVKFDCEP